jgi:shikimate kinase
LAIAPGQTIRDLHDERVPLYARYAQVRVRTDGQAPDQTCAAIIQALSGNTENPS